MIYSQISIISAIARELEEQHPGAMITQEQMNKIIEAANIVKAAMDTEQCQRKPHSGGKSPTSN